MKLLKSIEAMREYRRKIDHSVGFVPTMGALHDGHLSLVAQSRRETRTTLVSVYVNATQFNNPDDLDSYPDTLDADLAQLEAAGVAAVFLPDYHMMYPDDFHYQLNETVLSQSLCGEHRPGHFTGVLTVVMKLLNLVKPHKAYFGEKDYQQLMLISGMVEAFFLETEIVACPIVREPDGLAMSSRNLNLTACDREIAPQFHEILARGSSDEEVKAQLMNAGFEVDYVESVSGRRFGAVVMGSATSKVRLIDNVALG